MDFRRLPILAAPLIALLAGCGRQGGQTGGATSPALFKLTVQLDWFAEPEDGAFYTAETLGYFRDEGLDVTLLQGGPNTYVQTKVATGKVDIGQDDSTSSLVAIESGAPLLNIASNFQHDPSVLMMQEANPVKTWTDLNGRTIMARPEWPFLPYLRRKFGIDFKVIPHNFDFARLATDPNFIEQGYYIADPYALEQRGVKLKYLYVWDSGFDAYATIMTNRAFARKHPEQIRAFLRALYRGYKYYIEVDGGPAHDIMLRINPKHVTRGYLDWSRRQIIQAHLAKDADGDYLAISPARYRKEIDELTDLGILQKGALTPEQVMDAEYLPKGM